MEIKAVVEKFEDETALLKTNNGSLVRWPKDKLPPNCQLGKVIVFDINEEENYRNKKTKEAKEILNEILDIDS